MRFLLAALLCLAPIARAADTIDREIERLSRITDGVVGVTAVHLESGRRIAFHDADRFPMASSYKVPIAVQLLMRVDRGEVRLDDMVTLGPGDLHPGSGTLSELFNKPGVALSVRNLLELMLLISDNSATDIVLRLAGGAQAVTAKMRELGLEGIRVDRFTAELISDWRGVEKLPNRSEWTPEMFRRLLAAVTPEASQRAAETFINDPRDTAQPAAMAALLGRVYRKELHKPASAELLLDIMYRCQTGADRLKGMLPPNTPLAHKTGTIGGTTNDVGIVTLPDNAGHVALAVFVKSAKNPTATSERAIAQISRAVYDYFLFTSTPAKTAVDWERATDRIVAALRLAPEDRVVMRYEPGVYDGVVEPLRKRIPSAIGFAASDPAALERALREATVYLWLPLRDQNLPSAESKVVGDWLAKGGSRREIHFHWHSGSVLADGLAGEHPASYDEVYADALDVDYAKLSAAQKRVAAQLRGGTVHVATPAGTDLRFRVGDRPFNLQDGDASSDRMRKAVIPIDREIELPAGVLRVAPMEGTVEGRIVIPEARFGDAVVRGLRLMIEHGRVKTIDADTNVKAAREALSSDSAHAFREFGLGFNPKLRPRDGQTVLPYYGYGAGVVRLSLGDNSELGGAVRGNFRRWFFFPDAKVDVDGNRITFE